MKRLTPLFLTLLMLSCGGSTEENNSTEGGNENTSNDTVSTAESEEVEITRNDWETEKLFGNVKKVNVHSDQIDNEGNVFGMGGYDESTEFDEEGYITLKTSEGCCGYLPEEIRYKRNDKGQLTHRIFFVSEDYEEITDETPFDHKEKYFYNEEGVLVKMKIAGADSIQTLEYVYSWDDEGRLIKEEVEDVQSDDSWQRKIKYKESSEEVSFIYMQESDNYTREFFFDENGNLIKDELRSDGKTQLTTYTHEYDEQGNWIKRTLEYTYIDEEGNEEAGETGVVETRTIVYWE